ncbi:TetR/AcrR family transcriptional regulator [Pseudonocardia sp. CA-107938]|uniref:TetR/AcrR family transcriptional regulator n=1 Tax=Pseudonocardia sp. CA-107938 TaxID=3240021 RepID=UPI003D91DC76
MPATSGRRAETADDTSVRQRVLNAAFAAFTEAGYAETSTLEIASRARVSKRELYAVGNKQELLVACISERAKRLQVPTDLPEVHDRAELEHALVALGTRLLSETTNPTVIAVFRLAVAEAVRAPEVARVLDSSGRQVSRAALAQVMATARARGLLADDSADLVDQFADLLWGDLMITLLLGIAETPSPGDIDRRARRAATAFLRLH